eukprot:CAMPEP_0119341870 /NCGR_PEP_ID=MMETSP1333-20130426/103514_1 /TAXON_ID=418940 /ORGANISM="Scyphosphaera apsteinii, Strain RCC1455" /LENGTH=108 /DNA_ID=CAMNT_0007353959 /DNA_START=293 /DNA_END=616 /DNA_ORIENTATION=+
MLDSPRSPCVSWRCGAATHIVWRRASCPRHVALIRVAAVASLLAKRWLTGCCLAAMRLLARPMDGASTLLQTSASAHSGCATGFHMATIFAHSSAEMPSAPLQEQLLM